jgi:SAM-dependent methyltransferase
LLADPGGIMNYEKLNLQQPESEEDPFTEERYRQFHKYLPENTLTILDIGCNTGRGGAMLKLLNPELKIHGLDIVQARLDRLPDAYTFRTCSSSTSINAPDNHYDAIVSGEFIEHIYERDVQPTLAECFRVLRLRGRLLLTTPNPDSMKRRMRKESVLTPPSHVSQHFTESLTARLRMSGFSKIKVRGSGRSTRYLGEYAPMFLYGSYLAMGDKW